MNFNYCQRCFKKTAQTTEIVKFCAHCGKPFVANFEQKSIIKSNFDPNIEIETDEDENDEDSNENVRVPQLKGLQMEIEISKNSGVPVSSLARGIKRELKPTPTTTKPAKKLNKKTFWQQYSKEASAIRKK